jgi:hypothetical protein
MRYLLPALLAVSTLSGCIGLPPDRVQAALHARGLNPWSVASTQMSDGTWQLDVLDNWHAIGPDFCSTDFYWILAENSGASLTIRIVKKTKAVSARPCSQAGRDDFRRVEEPFDEAEFDVALKAALALGVKDTAPPGVVVDQHDLLPWELKYGATPSNLEFAETGADGVVRLSFRAQGDYSLDVSITIARGAVVRIEAEKAYGVE